MGDYRHFPANEAEAIAYLYVQSQDLTGKSALEVYELYRSALREIKSSSAASWNSQT